MGQKKPISVILAEGKTHLTKEQIKERQEQEASVKPAADKIECPGWLTDKVAKKEYKRIASELVKIGLITNLDVTTLASYCNAYVAYLKATEQLANEPLVVEQTNKAGFTNYVENPLIRIQLKYSDEMKKHATQMGLTINSRLKLVVPTQPEKKKKSKFDEFID
ncbi:phage terminase small subunit P27 family [Paenibacillus sp. NPDC093718]|uniref:phage terminase small subunit P27 family n=1 Tax=Paenibacillus sp. NPDC093718 TaxID=3390601 RepID=UPI003D0303BA